jgi:hypothetical protein
MAGHIGLLLFTIISMLWNVCSRAAFYTLVPAIAADLSLSLEQMSLLPVVVSASYMFGFWLSGRLRGSRHLWIGVGETAGMALALLLPWIRPFPLFLLVTALLFASIGLFWTNGISLMTDHLPPTLRIKGIAVVEMSSAAGFSLASLSVGFSLLWLAWEPIFLGLTLGLGLISFGLLLWVRRRYGADANGPAEGEWAAVPSAPPAPNRIRWAIMLGSAYTVVVALMGLMPVMLVQTMGRTPQEAALLDSLIRGVGLASPPLLAWLSQSIGGDRLLLGAYAVGASALLALAPLSFGLPFLFIFGLVMLSLIGTMSIVTGQIVEAAGRQAKAVLASTLTGSKLFGELLMPLCLGLLYARVGTWAVFSTTGLVVAAAALQVLRGRKECYGQAV